MNDERSLPRIESDVRRLSDTPRHGADNPGEHRNIADWIADELRAAGCVVEFQEFEILGQNPARTGRNVIGLREARESPRPAILIGAHYDTVPGSPGADDNASGVAAMLECGRALSDRTLRWPVVFAAFDAEEKQPPGEGLHGSTTFVNRLPGSLSQRERVREREKLQTSGTTGVDSPRSVISAAIILECIGYSSPRGTQRFPTGFQLLFPRAFDVGHQSEFAGNSLAVLSNRNGRSLARRFERGAREFGLPTLPVELPSWIRVPYNLRRSDHAPFWEAGIPAIMVGDTANFRNPNYHLPSDTADTLDFKMIGKVVEALVSLLT